MRTNPYVYDFDPKDSDIYDELIENVAANLANGYFTLFKKGSIKEFSWELYSDSDGHFIWVLKSNGVIIGASEGEEHDNILWATTTAIHPRYTGKGLAPAALRMLREKTGKKVASDDRLSEGMLRAYLKAGATYQKGGLEDEMSYLQINPPSYPVMSYAAAHKWEAMAKRLGVSTVARSSRGFMRAYQRAGSWSKLPEAWKRKRNAFVARHMAQGKKEQLWKGGTPSRRALALIMWAYMPPKRN